MMYVRIFFQSRKSVVGFYFFDGIEERMDRSMDVYSEDSIV